ncbi:NirD/YgiW/YdeI family stress tolerance protein, partial [Treponema sp. OttesenSCG-928-L16]|nr:NirD/YgiW/YdeI family stress tolerance protein [Treponema sp. OttesenSCG-928-L16]
VCSVLPAFAQSGRGGGFTGPSVEISTVEAVQKMRDDTYVALEGLIERSLGDEKYLFRDSTGTITVEIDNDDWRGLSVGPEDTVIIYGEVDKNFRRIEIDVDRIVLKQ